MPKLVSGPSGPLQGGSWPGVLWLLSPELSSKHNTSTIVPEAIWLYFLPLGF